jgi:hypothetical protein
MRAQWSETIKHLTKFSNSQIYTPVFSPNLFFSKNGRSYTFSSFSPTPNLQLSHEKLEMHFTTGPQATNRGEIHNQQTSRHTYNQIGSL